MQCARCGREFDRGRQDHCNYCKTVHTPDGEAIRDISGILCYIAERFGRETLLDRRRADALIADIFPKENAVRRLAYITLYDGCAHRLDAVRGKPFEVRSAAAARCVKSLRDEIGLKGRTAAEAVEAVSKAMGCEISFRKTESLPASATESRKNITDSAEQYSLGRHFDRIHAYDKALYWFEQAALQDYGEAQYYVGSYRMEGRGGERDIQQAREWFLRGAENGVAAAQYMTGYFYAEGIACDISEQAAFEWFRRAAEAGYADAVELIIRCYETGTYVERNPETARRWRHFAENGVPVYEEPEAEEPQPAPDDGEELYQSAKQRRASDDYEGAAMFYKRAAELGHARAQCNYGKCLYLGSGVEKDLAGAYEWFLKAAEQELDIAQYNLGVMYLKGVYVDKDRERAADYFRMAADNGHAEAAKILAKLEKH